MEFHIGDIVRVTKRISPITADGTWIWIEIMNQTIGRTGKVIGKRRSRTDNEDAYQVYLDSLPDGSPGEFTYSIDSLELETDLDRIEKISSFIR